MIIDLASKDDLNHFKQTLLHELVALLKGEEADLPSLMLEKIELSLSVSQLALLLRASMDSGLITNENKTAVLRCIVCFVRTGKTESISLESLRKKFYEAERGTKDAVKDLLMDLFKQVHKY